MGRWAKVALAFGAIFLALNVLAAVKGIKPGPLVPDAAPLHLPMPVAAEQPMAIIARAPAAEPSEFAIKACAIALHNGGDVKADCANEATLEAGAALAKTIQNQMTLSDGGWDHDLHDLIGPDATRHRNYGIEQGNQQVAFSGVSRGHQRIHEPSIGLVQRRALC